MGWFWGPLILFDWAGISVLGGVVCVFLGEVGKTCLLLLPPSLLVLNVWIRFGWFGDPVNLFEWEGLG